MHNLYLKIFGRPFPGWNYYQVVLNKANVLLSIKDRSLPTIVLGKHSIIGYPDRQGWILNVLIMVYNKQISCQVLYIICATFIVWPKKFTEIDIVA